MPCEYAEDVSLSAAEASLDNFGITQRRYQCNLFAEWNIWLFEISTHCCQVEAMTKIWTNVTARMRIMLMFLSYQ